MAHSTMVPGILLGLGPKGQTHIQTCYPIGVKHKETVTDRSFSEHDRMICATMGDAVCPPYTLVDDLSTLFAINATIYTTNCVIRNVDGTITPDSVED